MSPLGSMLFNISSNSAFPFSETMPCIWYCINSLCKTCVGNWWIGNNSTSDIIGNIPTYNLEINETCRSLRYKPSSTPLFKFSSTRCTKSFRWKSSLYDYYLHRNSSWRIFCFAGNQNSSCYFQASYHLQRGKWKNNQYLTWIPL